MLKYAAHIPHSPLLVPSIGPKDSKSLKKLRDSIFEITCDLYAKNIETIITITPQGQGDGSAYVLHFAPKFKINFHKFGDFKTISEALGEPELYYKIKHELGEEKPIMTITPSLMDHASAMASMLLSRSEKSYRFLPINYKLEEIEKIKSFGKSIRDIIEISPFKIAVISLGDLSRAENKNEKQAKEFDSQFLEDILKNKDNFNDNQVSKADSFNVRAFRPMAMLLGLLSGIEKKSELLKYEQPYGVGMAVLRFNF